jgi:hypothetical protein
MTYSLTSGASVIRDVDQAIVPADPRNVDWQAYQAWLAAGNTPTPYAAPPPAGVQIASASTPAINGIYAIDPASQQRIAAVSLYIQVNGKFPAAQMVLPWPDAAGEPHAFPSVTLFQAFATALADFVAAVDLGQTPDQPVPIP